MQHKKCKEHKTVLTEVNMNFANDFNGSSIGPKVRKSAKCIKIILQKYAEKANTKINERYQTNSVHCVSDSRMDTHLCAYSVLVKAPHVRPPLFLLFLHALEINYLESLYFKDLCRCISLCKMASLLLTTHDQEVPIFCIKILKFNKQTGQNSWQTFLWKCPFSHCKFDEKCWNFENCP